MGGVIPREYIKPVEAGISEALENGMLAGYPMVDVKVELIYGSYHDVDSSEMAFKIAGSMAFKEAAAQAQAGAPRADHERRGGRARGLTWATCSATSQSRRGKIGGMTQRGEAQVIARHGAAGRDVRVLDEAPLDVPGARGVLDGVRALRGSAEVEGGRDHREGRRRKAETARVDVTPVNTHHRNRDHGQGKVRADQAARERRHDRPRGPRQDDADGGAHQGVGGQGVRHEVHLVRRGRQGVGVAGAARRDQDPDDRDVATSSTRRPSATTRTWTARGTPTT